MTGYFDTHAHYDDSRFDGDREDVIASLPENGVVLALVPGCDAGSSRAALALAERWPHIYAAVGVHPHEASNAGEDYIDRLRVLADHPKAVAIGEIGLDYHYDFSPREVQRAVFSRQLELAEQLGLPVIIHDREAHADTLDILKSYTKIRAVFHCYSGSLEMAKTIVRMGHSISFTGSVTFKGARHALETAAWLPGDRIMLETDAPYLTPVPHRGKRNDSRYLPHIAQIVAEQRGIGVEELVDLSLSNGMRFFSIPNLD